MDDDEVLTYVVEHNWNMPPLKEAAAALAMGVGSFHRSLQRLEKEGKVARRGRGPRTDYGVTSIVLEKRMFENLVRFLRLRARVNFPDDEPGDRTVEGMIDEFIKLRRDGMLMEKIATMKSRIKPVNVADKMTSEG
jgi:hypothetical protein